MNLIGKSQDSCWPEDYFLHAVIIWNEVAQQFQPSFQYYHYYCY